MAYDTKNDSSGPRLYCDTWNGSKTPGFRKFVRDLDVELGMPLTQLPNLRHHVAHEALASKARLDCHDECQVDVRSERVQGARGRPWLDCDAATHTRAANSLRTRLRVVSRLNMKGKLVGAGVGKRLNPPARVGAFGAANPARAPGILTDQGAPS